ncbi:uncharacterized protein [Haliotis asinina]|uniref:uncharacterized protein n=1 Tax=Haliotis asinina TaxID=109174 RepID=UPI003531E705
MELMKQHNDLEKKVTVADLRQSLQLLKTGVARDDFPNDESEAGTFCKEILIDIIKRMKKLDPEATGAGEAGMFYSDCLHFVVAMLEAGPGTTHVSLIDTIRGYSDGYRRYYHWDTTPKTLRPVLKALSREFTSREPGFSYKIYSRALRTGFFAVVDKKRDPLGLYKEAQEDFLELYMFHETSFLSRADDVMDMQRSLSQMICSLYDNGIFYGIKNIDVFRCHLSRLQQVIGQADFPQSNKTLKIVLDVLHDLLVAVRGGNLFAQLSSDILSFLVNICKDKHGRNIHHLVNEVGILYNGVADTVLKGNSNLFETMTPAFGQFLDQLTDHSFLDVLLVKPAVCNVICGSMNNSKEHISLLIRLLKSLVKIPKCHCADTAQTVLTVKDKFLKWKPHVADAQDVLDLISDVEISGDPDDNKDTLTTFYVSVLSQFLKQIKRDRVIKELNERMVHYCLKCLASRSKFMFRLGSEVVTWVEFSIKKEKTLMFHFMKTLQPLLEDADFRWDLPASRNIAQTLAAQAMDAITDAKVLSDDQVGTLMSLTMSATQRDFINPDTNTPDTVFYDLYSTVGTRLCKMIDNPETAEKASEFICRIVSFMDSEFEQIQSLAISHVASIASKEAKALAPHMEAMVKLFVEEENTDMLFPITKVYPSNPEPLAPHFSTFFDFMDSRDDDVRELVLSLLIDVAQRQPQLFDDDNVATIIKEMKSADEHEQVSYLTILLHLSQQRQDLIVPHTTVLTQAEVHNQNGRRLLLNILKNIAVRTSDKAEPVMEYFTKLLCRPEDELSPQVLNAMRAVGAVHRPLLDNRKSFIADLRDTTKVQSVKDTCIFILDILEGRSLEALSADMKGVKQDVGKLGEEVTSTGVKVDKVQNDVTVQKERVDRAEVRLDYQRRELRELGETVEDTVSKVEEIDKKTLSHAPFWARDVSKLLNPENKHDWRLLSSRLGYSNDDIRGWAQTADPCQSMLNEWYSTNKTRDATFGVLQTLQEMNRTDAAVIVENAMKMAETVVEDEPQDYTRPPDIFISYQWSKQPEVQLLQRHLASAGYSCWLDIGQMGGGDKLFEKIDRGIRSATVVLCCVTDKYAGSPNCNREVNLAVTLGKPIIPLLLEKCTWPPAGSMGPIFSEYLFIRFFSRPGEEVETGAFWSKAKFRELLLQLSYNKVEVSLHVEPEYKNWWNQGPAIVHIPQNKPNKDGDQSKTTSTTTAQKTDLFLSYQWGKQQQIQKLYARLTSLGYTCWMDVHQMGGGDSLFDKIDKGVRGSKVVISCVTTKYCLSANCRREVSLADALKKPIVPLLLEPTAWPPSGPMIMVLTPLVYIDLSRDEQVQESWKGGKADELVQRIQNVLNHQGQNVQNNAAQDVRQGQTISRSPRPNADTKSKSCVLL